MNDQETKDAVKQVEHDVYVSIKEHFTALLREMDRRLQQALDNAEKAVALANQANERRLNLLNEFRAQNADDSKKYALREAVELLQTQVNRLYGGLLLLGVIGIANLVKLFFAH